jgi:hypothetical protein
VYLNGIEITRSNMPDGAITHTTLAAGAISGAAELDWHAQAVPPEAFARGDNAIAASLHQADACSSDVIFDLELRVATQADPPTATPTPSATATATTSPEPSETPETTHTPTHTPTLTPQPPTASPSASATVAQTHTPQPPTATIQAVNRRVWLPFTSRTRP